MIGDAGRAGSGGGINVAIPPVGGPYATLPAGRHPATLEQVYEIFVENAPFRTEREVIFGALALYANLLRNACSDLALWVNGGFISHKPWAAPKDADVVCVVPSAQYSNMCSNPLVLSLITLQGVSASSPPVTISRLQPMAGLIDGFIIEDVPASTDLWHFNWSLVKDEHGNLLPPATRKGYLEVRP
jgi:hypothetical protein